MNRTSSSDDRQKWNLSGKEIMSSDNQNRPNTMTTNTDSGDDLVWYFYSSGMALSNVTQCTNTK